MPVSIATLPLKRRLSAAGDLAGRAFLAPTQRADFAGIVNGTSLGGGLPVLAGRSVLVATETQLAAAIALIELDGVARRIVVTPPDLNPDHLAAVATGADVDAIITDRDAEVFAALGVATIVQCGVPLQPIAAPTESDVATEWVLLTSGTTGAPKLAAHSLAALTGAIRPIVADARRPVWGTFYDIRRYGGMQIFLRAVLGGATLVLSEAGEPVTDHLARLAAAGVTHLSGTPSHWRKALMSSAAATIDPGYVRLSGEIADQAILDALRAAFPRAAIGHAYASTEAGVGFEVDDGREGFPATYLDGDREVAMKVLDGSLRIRSPRAAARYVNVAEALADGDGFVDTGDMVERRGDRCFFVGRRGGIINVGGLKVHPEEVEAVINRHDRVRLSLVRARRSPITGAIVVADVVLNGADDAPDAGEALRGEIMALCRRVLPQHKVPASIRFVPALAVTAAGKLERHSA